MTLDESVPAERVGMPATEPSPSAPPACESLETSARKAGMSTLAVRWTVETPAIVAVPTFAGFDSQRPGSIPSEASVERTLAAEAVLVACA
jgi:hypothetical protein